MPDVVGDHHHHVVHGEPRQRVDEALEDLAVDGAGGARHHRDAAHEPRVVEAAPRRRVPRRLQAEVGAGVEAPGLGKEVELAERRRRVHPPRRLRFEERLRLARRSAAPGGAVLGGVRQGLQLGEEHMPRAGLAPARVPRVPREGAGPPPPRPDEADQRAAPGAGGPRCRRVGAGRVDAVEVGDRRPALTRSDFKIHLQLRAPRELPALPGRDCEPGIPRLGRWRLGIEALAALAVDEAKVRLGQVGGEHARVVMESAHHVAGGPVRIMDPVPFGYRCQNRRLIRVVDVLYPRLLGREVRSVHALLDERRNEDLELPRLTDKLGELVRQLVRLRRIFSLSRLQHLSCFKAQFIYCLCLFQV